MSSEPKTVIPKGALVVVTGANGYIASHVVDQLLLAGFQVRGIVRSITRNAWLQKYVDDKYGEGKLCLFEVPDMSVAGAYDDAVKDAAGLIHVATPIGRSLDPNVVIPVVVNGALNALNAAAKEPSMKRVVITSSSTAAADPIPNKEFTIDSNSWNEQAVKDAWAPPPYEGVQRNSDVYAASKFESEKAAWKFMRDEKPGFVLNAVLPNVNFGPIFSPEHQGYPSSAFWVKGLWDGFKGVEPLKEAKSQHFVNIQDTARIHVAALIFDDVRGERLFAYAAPFSWNAMLDVLRKLYPQRQFIEDLPNVGRDLSKVANERAGELLKRMGQPGWTGLEESIKAIADTLV